MLEENFKDGDFSKIKTKLTEYVEQLGKAVLPKSETDTVKDIKALPKFQINEIDQQPFADCDATFRECDDFLKFNADYTSRKAVPAPLTEIINKWFPKRRGVYLTNSYNALQSKLESTEKLMITMSEASTDRASVLVIRSIHLNNRLTACIEYNRREMENRQPELTETRSLLAQLKSYQSHLTSMLIFSDEVELLKAKQLPAYLPWKQRKQLLERNEAEKITTPALNELRILKRSSLVKRIRKTRQVI